MQKELADIGHERGIAMRYTIQGHGGVELAQNGVYVGGGEEFAGRSGGESSPMRSVSRRWRSSRE
jgi:hypothetical protein